MFTIIISEKGGAERREAFDKNEINVGRVQGNDLMLPKGNVSKHHARLLFRDGRFIVTDLKSTNGTYVNGRKISQATIVREGDKIYVGDFVLRLETAPAPIPEGPHVVGDDSQSSTPARPASPPRDPTQPPLSSAFPPSPGTLATAPLPAPTPRGSEPQGVSHYPLERDPDDSESAPDLGSPRAPEPPRPPLPSEARISARGNAVPAGSPRGAFRGSAAAVVRPLAGPVTGRSLPRESAQQAARRLAMTTLVDRVADVVELAPLERMPFPGEALTQQIERAVREQAKAMREEGEAPDGMDLELLARDAVRELVGLGPIGPLLDDEETSEIHVSSPDFVLAVRNGQPLLADPSFTSEDALARVVARLAYQSGQPLQPTELVIERRLGRAAHLVAISPLAASGWVLSLRKRRRVEVTLDELVRAGSMSRAIAAFLEACVAARANVLVVGSGLGVVSATLAALASAVAAGERVVVLQDVDEIAIAHAQVIPISLVDRGPRGEESVRAASRLGADRLVVLSLAGYVAAATIDAIGEGCEGVLAGLGAPSLRHGLARLASQVALARPGTWMEAAREAVGESFDIAVEVTRASDGRLRVLRVSELAGTGEKGVTTRDLFALSADGTGEAAFVASGVIPRLANDFAARGVRLDGSIFKRR